MSRSALAALLVLTGLWLAPVPAHAADPDARTPAAVETTPEAVGGEGAAGGGCMPGGGCCGAGACAKATQGGADDAGAAGGCPCRRRQQALENESR